MRMILEIATMALCSSLDSINTCKEGINKSCNKLQNTFWFGQQISLCTNNDLKKTEVSFRVQLSMLLTSAWDGTCISQLLILVRIDLLRMDDVLVELQMPILKRRSMHHFFKISLRMVFESCLSPLQHHQTCPKTPFATPNQPKGSLPRGRKNSVCLRSFRAAL